MVCQLSQQAINRASVPLKAIAGLAQTNIFIFIPFTALFRMEVAQNTQNTTTTTTTTAGPVDSGVERKKRRPPPRQNRPPQQGPTGETSSAKPPRRPREPRPRNEPGTSSSVADGARPNPRPRTRRPKPAAEAGGGAEVAPNESAPPAARREGNRRRKNFGSGLTQPDQQDSASSTSASGKRPENRGGRGKSHLPQGDDLTSTLIRNLSTPPYPDCPICFSAIRPEQAIWSCSPSIRIVTSSEAQVQQYCWTSFHIKCIRSWAEKSAIGVVQDARQSEKPYPPDIGVFVTRRTNQNLSDFRRLILVEILARDHEKADVGILVLCNVILALVLLVKLRHDWNVIVQRRLFCLSDVASTSRAKASAIFRAEKPADGHSTVESINVKRFATLETAENLSVEKEKKFSASWKERLPGWADMAAIVFVRDLLIVENTNVKSLAIHHHPNQLSALALLPKSHIVLVVNVPSRLPLHPMFPNTLSPLEPLALTPYPPATLSVPSLTQPARIPAQPNVTTDRARHVLCKSSVHVDAVPLPEACLATKCIKTQRQASKRKRSSATDHATPFAPAVVTNVTESAARSLR
ncbi:hypothetical protein D9613_008217 [Agrocybe pediades]|uniref:Uncharacterized protein n=1 Tax=Agrocybe pediades TaxID=84607 RepID=A0A8H4QU12_9AGAR|nr:hypothetical protein D9613_008217 [Agrocybe pediades]